jgi:hypothetical protein
MHAPSLSVDVTMATSLLQRRPSSTALGPLLLLLLLSTFVPSTLSFTPSYNSQRPRLHRLSAQPTPKRYDPTYNKRPPVFNKSTSQWEPSSETESSYGAWGSFLRGGPSPFLVRVLQPEQYDQAVFKYMAQTSCSRAEAQGNMDQYFNNAADWAYQKQEEARGAPVVDYTQLKPAQAVKVITWALLVTPFLGRCAYLIAFTEKGWSIGLDDIFTF